MVALATAEEKGETMKVIRIRENSYGSTVFVVVDCKSETFKKYIHRKYKAKLPSLFGTNAYVCSLENKNENKTVFYIWLPKFDWSVIEQGRLVHEILHLTFMIADYVGLKYKQQSEEAYCYLIDHLVIDIFWKLRNYHPIKRKKAKHERVN